jgi:hypothetical protein
VSAEPPRPEGPPPAGGWGQPPEGWPYGPSPYPPPRETAPGALAALVLGIIGLSACQLCAPFAWWQGHSAENAIRASGGMLDGKGMATAGKILGIIGTALLVLVVGFVIVAVAIEAGSE